MFLRISRCQTCSSSCLQRLNFAKNQIAKNTLFMYLTIIFRACFIKFSVKNWLSFPKVNFSFYLLQCLYFILPPKDSDLLFTVSCRLDLYYKRVRIESSVQESVFRCLRFCELFIQKRSSSFTFCDGNKDCYLLEFFF